MLIAPVTAGETSAISLSVAPDTGGSTGPRTSTCWSAPVPLKVTWMTLSSTGVGRALLSILNWYSRSGSNEASAAVAPGVRNARLFITSTMRPGAEPGNA